MSDVRAYQGAAIFSGIQLTTVQAYQLSAVVSVNTQPATNAYQLGAIFSLSPGKPMRYSAQRLETNGPLSILADMPKTGINQ